MDPKHQNLKGLGPGHENEPQMGPMGTSMCPGDFLLKQLRDFCDDDFFSAFCRHVFWIAAILAAKKTYLTHLRPSNENISDDS